MDLDRLLQHITHGEQGSVRDFSLALRGLVGRSMDPAENLADVPDKKAARDNLGLGALAERSTVTADLLDPADLDNVNARLGTFSTVADVENSHIPAVLTSIRALGFAVPGDGGGATLIEGTSGDPGATQSADGRWWKPLPGERGYNVKSFGAVGLKADGTESAHAEIQAAFDAAGPGGAVYFPPGTYAINSGQHVGVDVNGGDNRKVVGDNATILLPEDTPTARPLVLRNIDGLEVSGLRFKGMIPFSTEMLLAMGLTLYNVANAKIHDCVFEDLPRYGIILAEDIIGETEAPCPGFEVYDCTFRRCGSYGIQMFPKVRGGEQVIRSNVFEECGNYAIEGYGGQAIKTGQGFDRTIITGNVFINCANHPFEGDRNVVGIVQWSDVTVSDNTFIDCPFINIGIGVNTHSLGDQGLFKSLVVTGNIFHGTPATAEEYHYINVTNDSGGTSIYEANNGRILFSNNTWHNPGPKRIIFIRLGLPLPRVAVINNRASGLERHFLWSDNGNGGWLVDPLIEGNSLSIAPGSTAAAIRLYQSDGGRFVGNRVYGAYEESIEVGDHTGELLFVDNRFLQGNRAESGNRGAIRVINSTSPGVIRARGNKISTEDYAALFRAGTSAYTIYHSQVELARVAFGDNLVLIDEGAHRTLRGDAVETATTSLVFQDSNGLLASITPTGFSPGADDAMANGGASARWSQIYATSGTINTSDAREKTPLRQPTEAERAVAIRLSYLPGIYQWLSAIDEKGEGGARLHMGVLAQDVKAAFEAEGLDGFRYGVLCWDEWDAEDAEFDEDGNEVSPARPAGDRYGIRYDELAQWQAAGWNARLQALEEQENG